jgi:hypothetical protein
MVAIGGKADMPGPLETDANDSSEILATKFFVVHNENAAPECDSLSLSGFSTRVRKEAP